MSDADQREVLDRRTPDPLYLETPAGLYLLDVPHMGIFTPPAGATKLTSELRGRPVIGTVKSEGLFDPASLRTETPHAPTRP